MFTKRIKLFTIFGFDVHVDLSWFILLVLITWSLATGVFPLIAPGFSTGIYWAMGFVAALGLFLSIVLHELSHSLVARRFGLPMRGITLFIFGGVAEMTEEPASPKVEFNMAIAGPLASVVIGAVCYGLFRWGVAGGWPAPVNAVLIVLALINGTLAAFNIIPAFPLDGGRVLRSALWHWKGNLKWATRVTSRIGAAFGILLILFGVVRVIFGDFIGGIWLFLIGMFVRHAARMSYQQLLVRRAIEGEPVRRFMQTQVQTVSPSVTVGELVEGYFYRYHFKMFPVVEEMRLLGCVLTRDTQAVPRDEWETRRVREILEPRSDDNTIAPDADADKALGKMSRGGLSRLMVAEGDRLLGIISLKDLMQFIALKMELEEGGGPAQEAELEEEPPAPRGERPPREAAHEAKPRPLGQEPRHETSER